MKPIFHFTNLFLFVLASTLTLTAADNAPSVLKGEGITKDRPATTAVRATNATAAAAAARAARDARLAKLVGTEATNFTATHTIGDFKSLADLKGKVVMLDFFAHWCGPCIASFPSVRALHEELQAKGLQVLGVTHYYGYYKAENRTKRDLAPEKELEKMKEFVTEKNVTWPVAFVDKVVFSAYDCSAIPHVVLIDKAGKIRKVKVGYTASGVPDFRAEVEKLLAE